MQLMLADSAAIETALTFGNGIPPYMRVQMRCIQSPNRDAFELDGSSKPQAQRPEVCNYGSGEVAIKGSWSMSPGPRCLCSASSSTDRTSVT
jgi:hypothetical protein